MPALPGVTPASGTFTPADYATPQSVTVAAEQDADASNESTTLQFTATGIAQTDVTVNVTDDDPAPLTVTIAGGNSVAEGNGRTSKPTTVNSTHKSRSRRPDRITRSAPVATPPTAAMSALGAGTATIAAAVNATTVNAIVNCDFAVESNESVTSHDQRRRAAVDRRCPGQRQRHDQQ
ncbi:MAG: hypothetical protein IPP28_00285 [Xanthomonadales bacterium]|nr:hypothetical protein [Xanthomonadales bacterium]